VDIKEIEQGQESKAFWDALTGGEVIEFSAISVTRQGNIPARLFQCSTATGTFKVCEVFNYSQDDLDNDDVMILDVHSELFVWIGSGSNDQEKNMAMETAIEYIKGAPAERKDNPIYLVSAGHEPPIFTCHFHAWDSLKARDNIKLDENGDSVAYLRKLAKLQEDAPKLFRMNSQRVLPKIKAPAPEGPKPSPKGSRSMWQPRGSSSASPSSVLPTLLSKDPSNPSSQSLASLPDVGGGSPSTSPKGGAAGGGEGSWVGKKMSSIASKFSKKKPEKSDKPSIEEDEEGEALALYPSYDHATLKVRPLPDDVSHEMMEKHLSHEEFHDVIKMSRKEWEKAPKWKKIKIKKETGLF